MLYVAIACASVSTGCKKDKDSKAGDTSSAGASYRVRGLVKMMPTADVSEMEIHHEAIPDFVNAKGEKSGMMSMVMPFGVKDSVDVSAIAVGDKISFEFDIDYERNPKLQISKIEKLDVTTPLSI